MKSIENCVLISTEDYSLFIWHSIVTWERQNQVWHFLMHISLKDWACRFPGTKQILSFAENRAADHFYVFLLINISGRIFQHELNPCLLVDDFQWFVSNFYRACQDCRLCWKPVGKLVSKWQSNTCGILNED